MKKITTKETSQIINVMFSRVPDERRQKIYNHIDELMMNYFNVEEKDIPWLNKDINKHENYNNILNLFYLCFYIINCIVYRIYNLISIC